MTQYTQIQVFAFWLSTLNSISFTKVKIY